MDNRQSILIFGGGLLQKAIIDEAKRKGLFTVLIDPDKNAYCKDVADVFRVIKGDDFKATVDVAKEFNVKGIVTSSTDKPLRMMAQVASLFSFSFFSEQTAINTTDKLLMKKIFIDNNIPCALGVEIVNSNDYNGGYPAIIKPRDNSGSRGVILVNNKKELERAFYEVLQCTSKDTVLVEKFIEGQEYSVEGIHFDNKHVVLQYTEKETTPFPYNAEISHKQPADIEFKNIDKINQLIRRIGVAFNYQNCVSHTELKITESGDVYIIETSPRMGGDFITSHLVPLSTGVNMESLYIDIALGKQIDIPNIDTKASSVFFFSEEEKIVDCNFFNKLKQIQQIEGVVNLCFKLEEGDSFPMIKSSLDRYGYVVLKADNKADLLQKENKIKEILKCKKVL